MKIINSILFILMMLFSLAVIAAPTNPIVTKFLWSAVTTDVQGNTIVPDHYTVYCGTASRNYNVSVSTNALTMPISTVVTGDNNYYCAVTATSATGIESAYSDEVNFFVKNGTANIIGVPAAPGNFKIE